MYLKWACCILLNFLIQGVELNPSLGERVNSAYGHLVPDINPEKKNFLKDGPYRPLDKVVIYKWYSNKQFFHCKSVAQNGTSNYCETWSADAGDGHIIDDADYKRAWGRCNCWENVRGKDYCTFWYCGQQELDVSDSSPDSFPDLIEKIFTDIEKQDRDINYRDCVCRYESPNGKYCQQWHCQGSDGHRKHEADEYKCDEPSKNENFCQSWSGHLLKSWRRGWSWCSCRRPLTQYCEYWICYEKELKRYFFINFILLMFCLIVCSIVFLVYAINDQIDYCARVVIIVVAGVVLIGEGLLCAGLFGLILGAACTIFFLLLVLVLCISGTLPQNY